MLCKHCGKEIAAGSAFCTNCGKPVEVMAAVEEVKESLTAAVSAPDENARQQTASAGSSKSKGLLGPLITLIAAVSGWIYMLFSNSIEGLKAWFTSSEDLQNNVSQNYNYYGNNASQDELIGNIVMIGVMVLFTVLLVFGLIWLCKRVYRKFVPKKRG